MQTEASVANELTGLLTEARWVRALARRLAASGHEADDLVQDACLVALQRAPGEGGENLRGWLAKVLRNLVRQRGRGEARRQRREDRRATHAPEVEPPAADLVERAATQRAVVDAVLALDEPYRTTILLRFFEDLPPRAIASRQGVPVGTVRTRLTRGLEQLRRRLDSRRGGRAAWIAALLPLPALPSSASVLGAIVMKTKILTVAAVAVGALAITATTIDWSGANGADVAAEERAAAATGGAPVDATETPDLTAPNTDRVAVPTTPAAAAGAAPAAPARVVVGRTVDAEGRPVPRLPVGLAGDSAPRATSDAAAAFELTLPPGRAGRIVAAEPGWSTVLAATVRVGAPPQLALVVAAPTVTLAGVVRGDDGRSVAGAKIRVVWPADLRSRLSDISDAADAETLLASTDEIGAFALDAARVRGAILMTTAEGYVPDRRPVPGHADAALQIVLARPVMREGAVQGQVIDHRGMPVAGARVALGDAMVTSAEDGGFLVDDGEGPLTAAFAGHRRGVLDRPAAGWPPFVVLPLGGEPLSIRGRVATPDGAGVAGVKVWLLDATPFGRARRPLVCEGIATARTTMSELFERYRAGEFDDPQRVLRTTPTATWPFVFTDEGGHFELPGLEDRRYDLRAMDMDTLLMVDTHGVAAGAAGILITMPDDAVFPRLLGVVADRDGNPVAGVDVRVQCDALRIDGSTMHASTTQQARTDEHGHFRLEDVPKTGAYLRLDGESILPQEFGRGVAGGLLELSAGDPENLAVTVRVRLHVQVELGDPDLADALAVLDLTGETLPINVFVGRGRRTTELLPLESGKSPVFVVPDTAATLVLQKNGEEVRREALVLRRGAVNKLTW